MNLTGKLKARLARTKARLSLVFTIGLRNLVRQRRRNILLGSAIAIGMVILVMATSFSRGITDTLFNKVIVFMTGHVEVAVSELDKRNVKITREMERVKKLIAATMTGVKQVNESIGSFGRIVGNGKADSIVVVGLRGTREDFEGATLLSGSLADFTNGKYEAPIILYSTKAKDINVKLHDTVSVRFETIHGSQQSARCTVVAIGKSSSMFENMVAFLPLGQLKKLMGFQPHETSVLQVILHDPTTAKLQADRLHAALAPGLAVIDGTVRGTAVTVVGLPTNAKALAALGGAAKLPAAEQLRYRDGKGALVTRALAARLGLAAGGKLDLSWKKRYGGEPAEVAFPVVGFYDAPAGWPADAVIVEDQALQKVYQPNLPAARAGAWRPADKDPLAPHFSREWRLQPRTADSESFIKKEKQLNAVKFKGTVVDVRTMYETASMVLQIEGALNLVTFACVILLFFLTLIGVINTLRMSIRERTREIGTLRAIGMRRETVRDTFLAETLLLAFFASLAGIVVSLVLMWLVGLPAMDTDSALGMLLVQGHLHFLPTFSGIFGNVFTILQITLLTAYFPARRAARMSAAAALRHYE